MNISARAWAETITIPTYPVGEADKNPMFFEKRVYQGSSGVVYPHPVIDRISDEKADREYLALFLENRYLKIMILPEIGGRVQMALDKTNNYHFVYYNRVIKPALVGLAGPWISGGIEFNWPQHHRPSTFDPVDWRLEEGADGSKTVWCSEIERMFRTKGMYGFTLYPDRAYLAIRVQLYNRTSEPQTFLWWANPAVSAHDDYQSAFPPDVYAVMDHGKRDVSSFPIATGTYYKMNYAPGTDISRHKNIPVPTSYMVYHSDFDFVGSYDHQKQAGMLHVANHHLVPGKKQWTWGCGDFGQSWYRQLTDDDGPYVELMCGAYTDNQPDFSWLQPGEEKSFTQVFMPYKGIGPAKNASQEAVLNLEVADSQATIGVYVTEPRRVQVRLLHRGQQLLSHALQLSPETAFTKSLQLPEGAAPQDLTLQVLEDAKAERLLVSYTPLPDEKPEVPAPATPARPPQEIGTSEELFLNGLHLEQYRHAIYAPEPYYQEALLRDPYDTRCNNAMGLLLLRRGRFAEAEPYFRRAIERLTLRNPNPYDGEPFYNLGMSLKMQARYDEAVSAFYKATWNAAWQDAGYFELARLAAHAGRFEKALELTGNALGRNGRHHKARHLKIALLRRLAREEAALDETVLSLELDPVEYGALWERHLLRGDTAFQELTRGNAHTYVEIALDYTHAGLFDEAVHLLTQAPGTDPMIVYTLGWVYSLQGDEPKAAAAFNEASRRPADYCFPNRLEDVLILEAAMRANPKDARAPYYLGLFWYAHRRYAEAVACWELARELNPKFPTVHRNLGLAYYNKLSDRQRALRSLETAFSLNPSDARVLFELDQLHKKLNRPPTERLSLLEQHPKLVAARDDLMVERVTLLNLLGKPEQAYQLLMARQFHPWEGGEGMVTGQYVTSLVEMAKRAIQRGEPEKAVALLERTKTYPHNLGEGKLHGAQENNILYYRGCAYRALGKDEHARAHFEKATVGLDEPTSAMYYNDRPPDMVFYRGLAHRELGHSEKAQQIFAKLIEYGQSHMNDDITIDYFAVSLPDLLVFDEDLNQRHRLHCLYMMALGYLGLCQHEAAQAHFAQVLAINASHLGATIHRNLAACT